MPPQKLERRRGGGRVRITGWREMAFLFFGGGVLKRQRNGRKMHLKNEEEEEVELSAKCRTVGSWNGGDIDGIRVAQP